MRPAMPLHARPIGARRFVPSQALLSEVPRLVPTTGWPTSDYTIIVELELVAADFANIGYVYSVANNLNSYAYTLTSSPRLSVNFPARGSNEAISAGPHTFLFSQDVVGYTQAYIDDVLVNQGSSSISPGFLPVAGVGVMHDNTNPTVNPATKFKVLSGVYTSFATADAVTGPGLIFNGLVP